MDIHINTYKTTKYTESGYTITGNLMVFDYSSAVAQINKNKVLQGHGQFSYYDILDKIYEYLRDQQINYKVKLHVPDLVIELL